MVGMRWNDWNTMPILRPRKRASASSPSSASASPATVTDPVSDRSSPAMTMSRVDFPEPDGPTRPIASPRPILRSMSLRIWTRAAPRPSDRLTPASAIAVPARPDPEVSCMWFRSEMPPAGATPRSYGGLLVAVQRSALLAVLLALVGSASLSLGAAERTVRIVALGDSLTAGWGLPGDAAFPARLERALKAKGLAVEVAN